jgi:eukaryotic-like serine/threonine-protein kinase
VLQRPGAPSSLGEPLLRTALSLRVSALPVLAARLLELLAFAGEPLLARVALLASGAGYDALELLDSERMVRCSAGSSPHGAGRLLECYHDRIREHVLAALSDAQRRDHAERLAEVLATLDEQSAELLRRCLAEAGDLARAIELACAAAERATAALAFDRAAELYVEALGWQRQCEAASTELMESCAVALEKAGRCSQAAALYRELASELPERCLELRNRAARQLMFSGDYLEGMLLLEELCAELEVPLPTEGLSDQLAFGLAHVRLRAGRLSFRLRDASSHGLRLDVAESLTRALLNYRPGPRAVMAAQSYLRLAMSVGDRTHALTALALNAIVSAVRSPGRAWTATLMQRLGELAAEPGGDPRLPVVVTYVRGLIAHNEGQLLEAERCLHDSWEVLQNEAGVRHSLDVLHWYKQLNAHALGQFATIVSETPAAVSEAFRRGRVWLGAIMTGPAGMAAWLTIDDVDTARRRLDEARRRRGSPAQPLLPDAFLLHSETLICLYEGRARLAFELHRQHAPVIARSMNLERTRPDFQLYYGSVAAAALGDERLGSAKHQSLKHTVVHAQARMRRAPRLRHCESYFEATLALDRGDVERGVQQLRRFLESPLCVASSMTSVCVRHRLGQLLQGDEGRTLMRESELAMRAQGVKNIDAFMQAYSPGCTARAAR